MGGPLNKVYVVTGGTSGIGLHSVIALAKSDKACSVVVAAPSIKPDSLDLLALETGNNNIHFEKLDLSSLHSVCLFAQKILCTYDRIDGLVLAAGILTNSFSSTPNSFESTLQINYLAQFLLIQLLLPLLNNTAATFKSNVQVVSIAGWEICYPKKVPPPSVSLDSINSVLARILDNTESSSSTAFNGLEAFSNANLLIATASLFYSDTDQASITSKHAQVFFTCYNPGSIPDTNLLRTVQPPETPTSLYYTLKSNPFYKKRSTAAQAGEIICGLIQFGRNGAMHYYKGGVCRIGEWPEMATNPEFRMMVWQRSLEGLKGYLPDYGTKKK